MTRHALYVVGVPGVGKSTLVSEMTNSWLCAQAKQPVAHCVYDPPGVVELGQRRDNGFPGTDTLSMSAITRVDPWVREEWSYDYLLGEGDRLAVDRFFTALLEGGWKLDIVWLSGRGVAAERRARRAERLGVPPQKESWVKGRETKVQRLVERWAPHVLSIPAGSPLDQQVYALSCISPVAARLLGEPPPYE